MPDAIEMIGGMITLAELQQKAIKETSEAVSHLLLDAGRMANRLENVISTIPENAEKAAKNTIGLEIKEGLADASTVIGASTDIVVKLSLDSLIKQAKETTKSANALNSKYNSAMRRMILISTIGPVVALVVASISIYASFYWQSHNINTLQNEIDTLQNKKIEIQANIDKMTYTKKTLEDSGMNLHLSNCGGYHCVEVVPNIRPYGTESSPYYILR